MRRHWIITAGPTVLVLAACGNPSRPAHHAAKPPAAVATQSPSCAGQVHAWAHDQGVAQLHQLRSDTGRLSKDGRKAIAALGRGSDAASQFARVQADATALETDAQAAASNPPPACADAADYGTAMQDYTTAAQDQISAVNNISSGNNGAADALLRATASAMQRGISALSRSNAAVNNLGG